MGTAELDLAGLGDGKGTNEGEEGIRMCTFSYFCTISEALYCCSDEESQAGKNWHCGKDGFQNYSVCIINQIEQDSVESLINWLRAVFWVLLILGYAF